MTQDYTADSLELKALNNIPMVEAGDNLVDLIEAGLTEDNLRLKNQDVLVIAQKIISKSEGRLFHLSDVEPSEAAMKLAAKTNKDPKLVELILQESSEIVRQVDGLIITRHKLGFVMANAGIDQSNVMRGTALLLPVNPNLSAQKIRDELKRRFNVDVAIIISDSIGRAWRNGIVGHAIGVSGMHPIVDLRKAKDLYGRELRVSEVAIADEISAAATLLMGQAAEGKPIVLMRGLNVSDEVSKASINASKLVRDTDRDLFR